MSSFSQQAPSILVQSKLCFVERFRLLILPTQTYKAWTSAVADLVKDPSGQAGRSKLLGK